jgi:hypothetical protein
MMSFVGDFLLDQRIPYFIIFWEMLVPNKKHEFYKFAIFLERYFDAGIWANELQANSLWDRFVSK